MPEPATSPQTPTVWTIKALLAWTTDFLAKKGNFPPAAEEYRTYLKLSPSAPEADQLRRQLTEWEGLGVIPRAETTSTASDNNKEKP